MRLIVILFFLILSGSAVLAQGEDNSLKGVPIKERIVTGGGFGMGFGNRQDYISISPIIGYSITRKFMAGSGISYQYIKYKNLRPGKDVSTNNYGVSPFLRFNVYKGFFIQSEYEVLNYELVQIPSLETVRSTYNSFLAGGGYIQPLGRNAAIFFMALYNFSYVIPKPGEYTPYDSPLILRAGINIGGFIF